MTKTMTTAPAVSTLEYETPVFAGVSLMELVGLEPATSWVRFRNQR
jgi:hypothetical protein